MEKLTKIVATLSDKKCEPDFVCALYEAGVDVVRINTAHQSVEAAAGLIENVRSVSERIALMVDTKGPEIRTNDQSPDILVERGQRIRIKGAVGQPSTPECIAVNYDGFVKVMQPGRKIMIDDGDIELLVLECFDQYLVCEVRNAGVIKARKSVNLPGTPIDLPSLNEKDREFIDFAIHNDIDFIAHSFVRNKEDVLAIQQLLDAAGSPVKIIAKIENQQGLDNIDEILDHVYGIMVARGDLAIEVPAEQIPVIQASLVKKCIRRKKAVIIATQMLHSMIHNPRPTRAEVSDIANAVFSGADAIMLSGETAFGEYPVEAVQIMTRTVREAEKGKIFQIDTKVMPHDNQVSVFLSKTAVRSIQRLNTRAIITDTDTGKTARYLAAFRGRVPIYAQCYDNRVVRELGLIYGVFADYMDVTISKKEFTRNTLNRLLEQGEVNKDDLIAILAGNFGKKAGPSYVEVSTVNNMLQNG